MIKNLLCAIILTFLSTITSWAQSACELTLTNAQEEFDAGRFTSVPGLLQECLTKNQTREWEQRAYLLLAETYLLLQDNENAEASYLKVLQANPEFVTDPARDPIDLVYLSKKYTAAPIFSFSGGFGLNASFPRVINDVDVAPQGNPKEDYSPGIGWKAALGFDYHYSEKLSAGVEVNYQYNTFSHTTKDLFQANNTLEFQEKQYWLRVPVIIKYSSTKGNLRPYGYLGLSFNFLTGDKASLVLNNNDESPEYDYKFKRTSYANSFLLGAGLKYKWDLRYLFGEVRYSLGMTNLTNPDARYPAITDSWPYADDDFKLDNLYIGIGYIFPLYHPRKLKHANTKSVLRKIGRRGNEK